MHVVKTALRESFDNIHVGFLYSSKDETIKIKTNRGKIGGEKMLLFYIPHVGALPPIFYHPCYVWVWPFQLFYRILKNTKRLNT